LKSKAGGQPRSSPWSRNSLPNFCAKNPGRHQNRGLEDLQPYEKSKKPNRDNWGHKRGHGRSLAKERILHARRKQVRGKRSRRTTLLTGRNIVTNGACLAMGEESRWPRNKESFTKNGGNPNVPLSGRVRKTTGGSVRGGVKKTSGRGYDDVKFRKKQNRTNQN